MSLRGLRPGLLEAVSRQLRWVFIKPYLKEPEWTTLGVGKERATRGSGHAEGERLPCDDSLED